MSVTELVCPRCGASAAADSKFCGNCGLDLSSQFELPTRGEWEARQTRIGGADAGANGAGQASPGRNRTVDVDPLAVPAAASTPIPGPEMAPKRRNTLLGSAGIIVASSFVFTLIGAILVFVDALTLHAPAPTSIGEGLSFAVQAVLIAGFTLAGLALLGSETARPHRLRVGFVVSASAIVVYACAQLTVDIERAVQHTNGTYLASLFVFVVSLVTAGVSLFLVSRAFNNRVSSRGSSDLNRCDLMLGWGAAVFVAAIVLKLVADIIALVFFSDNQAPGGITGGYTLTVVGDIVVLGAGIIATIAFFQAVSRRRRTQPVVAWRDGVLAIGTGIASVGFLLAAIGGMVYAGATSSIGFDGKIVAAGWLTAVQILTWMSAFICASIGLTLSWRRKGR